MGNRITDYCCIQSKPNPSENKPPLQQSNYENSHHSHINDSQKKSTRPIEDYEPKKFLEIGWGGSVSIVRKKNCKDDKQYALKIIEKTKFQNKTILSQQALERDVLRRQNAFLVEVYNIFSSPKKFFVIMEYIEPGNLLYYIQKEKWFNQQVIRQIAAEVLWGLKFLHREGIIYRNLKPQNILVLPDGHIKLSDYWFFKTNQNEDTLSKNYSGIIEYTAPQILQCQEYDKKVDMWELGVLIYEMKHGETPFGHFDQQNLIRNAINQGLYTINEDCSADLKDLILQLLSKNPEQRPTIDQALNHPFFVKVDWDLVSQRRNMTPFKDIAQKFNTKFHKMNFLRPSRIFLTHEDDKYPVIREFNINDKD